MGIERSTDQSKAATVSESVTAARAVARLARQLAVAVGEVGLTPSQYRVMAFLADGESVASSIAGRLNVTKPSVTALIDGLEEKGLVRRRRSDGDRRVVKTVLTDEGREALAAADAAGSARIDSLASHLPKRDRKTAIEGLAIWHEALNAHLAEVMSAR